MNLQHIFSKNDIFHIPVTVYNLANLGNRLLLNFHYCVSCLPVSLCDMSVRFCLVDVFYAELTGVMVKLWVFYSKFTPNSNQFVSEAH